MRSGEPVSYLHSVRECPRLAAALPPTTRSLSQDPPPNTNVSDLG